MPTKNMNKTDMKSFIIWVLLGLLVIGCGGRTNREIKQEERRSDDMTDTAQMEKVLDENNLIKESPQKMLEGNEARFNGWIGKDWYENDYFRILRKFFDAYVRGEIENRDDLMFLKPLMNGKFVIYNAEPFLLGGMFISFVFLESPNDIYDVWVYSYVNEGQITIDLSSVRSIHLSKTKSNLTKDSILHRIKEYPENKLW